MEWFDKLLHKKADVHLPHISGAKEPPLAQSDILDAITKALLASQVKGRDARVYAPNRFVITICIKSNADREHLLPLLKEDELLPAIERYRSRHGLVISGPFEFSVEEVDPSPGVKPLIVRAFFDGEPTTTEREIEKPAMRKPISGRPAPEKTTYGFASEHDDPFPVQESYFTGDEPDKVEAISGTWGALLMEDIDGNTSIVPITKPVFAIGRSRSAGNDLVLDRDEKISKRHLRIELGADGGAMLYDLASTNGTSVNGRIVPVCVEIANGDNIVVGGTRLVFHRDPGATSAQPQPAPAAVLAPLPPHSPARLTEMVSGREHVLASDNLIGSSGSCDITLAHHKVSTHQARITKTPDGKVQLVDLSASGTTVLNDHAVQPRERFTLTDGDKVVLGGIVLTYNDR